jgi:hypothetical protein
MQILLLGKTGCYGKAIEIFENLQNDPNTTALFLKEDGVVPQATDTNEHMGN